MGDRSISQIISERLYEQKLGKAASRSKSKQLPLGETRQVALWILPGTYPIALPHPPDRRYVRSIGHMPALRLARAPRNRATAKE
jgi:hypothetical protein